MVYRRVGAVIETKSKPLSLGWAIAITVAFCALGVRASEASGDSIGFARVLVSALAIGTFFIVQRISIVRGIAFALAIEIVGGSAVFALVDYPFIRAHATDIGAITVTALERLERRSAHAPATLAQL